MPGEVNIMDVIKATAESTGEKVAGAIRDEYEDRDVENTSIYDMTFNQAYKLMQRLKGVPDEVPGLADNLLKIVINEHTIKYAFDPRSFNWLMPLTYLVIPYSFPEGIALGIYDEKGRKFAMKETLKAIQFEYALGQKLKAAKDEDAKDEKDRLKADTAASKKKRTYELNCDLLAAQAASLRMGADLGKGYFELATAVREQTAYLMQAERDERIDQMVDKRLAEGKAEGIETIKEISDAIDEESVAFYAREAGRHE